MNKVKVLIEGYAKEIQGGWLASSTTTLIRSENIKIIVDPGTNRELLLNKLATEDLNPGDINVVFMTHYHPDHNLLTGIFERAQIVDDTMIYEKDKQWEHDGKIPKTDIVILKTPGHEQFHGSLLVNTREGNIIVAGDLFWWASNENVVTDEKSLLEHKDPFEKNHKDLIESRKKILTIADYIIPGHGKMFKVIQNNVK
jgi:glyoxylase-like metal-dependent hydrolase (beta-lactamase superfamily II)